MVSDHSQKTSALRAALGQESSAVISIAAGHGRSTTCGATIDNSDAYLAIMTNITPRSIHKWRGDPSATVPFEQGIQHALAQLHAPVFVVRINGRPRVTSEGIAAIGQASPDATAADVGDINMGEAPLLAYVPPLSPQALGDAGFRADHRIRAAYVAGEMANGIASAEMVIAMARAGMLGFFGAAGLSISSVEAAIDRIQSELKTPANSGDAHEALTYGFNLIHSPAEPDLESAVADLYLRRGVRLVSASAYLDLTLPLIRYRVSGIRALPDGTIDVPNQVIAKVSRIEVARKFFSPPPANMLAVLVQQGVITAAQAKLAEQVPVAYDLTAEADSGGHTDNRPLVTLLPTMLSLRDDLSRRFNYARGLRVGAAGGIATPHAVAGAFAMGAAYVMTGSINQACVEAATSPAVKDMLAKAGQADVMMAPAADMFEMGVKVQVLKWGTLFAVRAQKLYELYRSCESMESMPAAARAMLERDYFRGTLEQAWDSTRRFFEQRDPRQLERAAREPKHKLALLFRSYLGQSSKWAVSGDPSRRPDYQVWCGPAMGAFNEWAKGTPLEVPTGRRVADVARRLMEGAAVEMRKNWLTAQMPAELASE